MPRGRECGLVALSRYLVYSRAMSCSPGLFYYVVMHSAFISDELIPWTFFYYVVMHYAFISDGLMPCTLLTILRL